MPEQRGIPADQVDPTRHWSKEGESRIGYLNHPDAEEGFFTYDRNTLTLLPQRIPLKTVKLPLEFLKVAQPNIHTCTEPRPGNRGCTAWSGCPYGNAWPPPGDFNVIIRKGNKIDSCRCDQYWVGRDHKGRPLAQVANQEDGWELVLDRTTTPARSARYAKGPDGNQIIVEDLFEQKVDNLGPMYNKLLKKEAEPSATPEEPAKRGPGRPRKVIPNGD